MSDSNNIEEGTPLVSYQNEDEIALENVAETLAPRSTKFILAIIAAGNCIYAHMYIKLTYQRTSIIALLSSSNFI